MSDATELADRVKQLETQVAELQKAMEVLLRNPNWRELISLSSGHQPISAIHP